jgi:hypothetical protein
MSLKAIGGLASADVRALLEGSRLVDFEVATREDAYTFAVPAYTARLEREGSDVV